MSEYELEPLSEQNLNRLAPLMQDAFGHRDVHLGYFRWKYLENPAGSAIGLFAIAPHTGEVAAFYGMIPEIYCFGSARRCIYQSCDTMTLTSHRRRGLFRQLALETYRQAESRDPDFFALGFGGTTSTPGFKKMNWEVSFEIPFYFKPRLLCRLAAISGSGVPLIETSEVTPELCALISDSGANRPNGKIMDQDFIRWRLGNPRRVYNYLINPEGAYAIYYTSQGFIFLFDFFETSKKSGRVIIARLAQMVIRNRLKGVLTFGQRGRDFEARLKRHGFLRNDLGRGPASQRIPFITYTSNRLAADLQRPEAWDITPFDHDSY